MGKSGEADIEGRAGKSAEGERWRGGKTGEAEKPRDQAEREEPGLSGEEQRCRCTPRKKAEPSRAPMPR